MQGREEAGTDRDSAEKVELPSLDPGESIKTGRPYAQPSGQDWVRFSCDRPGRTGFASSRTLSQDLGSFFLASIADEVGSFFEPRSSRSWVRR
jgi:hypothetical protein